MYYEAIIQVDAVHQGYDFLSIICAPDLVTAERVAIERTNSVQGILKQVKVAKAFLAHIEYPHVRVAHPVWSATKEGAWRAAEMVAEEGKIISIEERDVP